VPVLFGDPFTALIRSISAQQVNLRWRRRSARLGRYDAPRDRLVGGGRSSPERSRMRGSSTCASCS
jgi:hypothetical protein